MSSTDCEASLYAVLSSVLFASLFGPSVLHSN